MDTTNILETYRAIAKGKLSESYYDLLDNKVRSSKPADLPVVNLSFPPQLSSYSAALKAEQAGYTPINTGKGIDIVKDGKTYKSLIGKLNEISDQDIDRALASVWVSNGGLHDLS